MDSSTPISEDIRKKRSRRVLKPKDGHRASSLASNITKPLPKTPPASPPTQLEQSTLPPELSENPSSTPSATTPATTRVHSSSRTAKVAPAATGHGNSRSPSSSNAGIVRPGSSMDSRTLTGVRAAAPTSSRRGPSLDNGHGRSGSISAQHSRTPSSDAENRRTGAGPPRTRGPSFEQQRGRPSVDGVEGSRSISFDMERRNVPVGNSIRPVAKTRGPSLDLPTGREKASTSRNPSIDMESRRPGTSAVPNPRSRGPSFEPDIRRPGVGIEAVKVRSPSHDRERSRTGVSASDSGHANPRNNEPRRDPQGYPVRFNSTPTNPLINHRGYTPVPVTNTDDDEEQAHGQETSTRLSHEKTLEDMPSFTLSRPYPSDKEEQDPAKQEFNRDMRRRRLRVLSISFVVIALVILTIILLVRFVRPQILSAYDSIGQGQGSSDNSTLNADQSQCLSDFRTNAPGNPASYTCWNCLSALQNVSQQFLQNTSNTNDVGDIQAAKQFCGLQAIFNSTAQNQGGLSNIGWFKDTHTCTWGGIACDSSGVISTLNMTFPAVPQTLPLEMSALTSLTNLMITGDRSIPFGPLSAELPSSLRSLQLYNTHLEGLATADASLFQQNGPFAGLTELILDGNPSLGTSLPTGLFGVQLQTLIVRNQQLNMQLDALGNSGALASSLTTLDLSLNNLTGTLGLLNLPHVTRLDLSNNNLSVIPPTFTWPSALQSVHFQNNPLLNGTLATLLCTDTGVTDCSFQNTAFSAMNLTCGTCRF